MFSCGSGPCNQYGTWLCFPWSSCSTTCGVGGRLRPIVCYDTLTKSESNNCLLSHKPTTFERCNQGPCLLSPECKDVRGIQCYVLRSVTGYCASPRYTRLCCKTCEDIIFRSTTTTLATTTPATTPSPTTTPPPITTPEISTLIPQ